MTRKPLTLERKIRRSGTLFMLPWLFGIITFFVIPFAYSLIWSFQKVNIASGNNTFVGFDNYVYAFMKNKDFLRSLISSMTTMLKDVVIILVFSFFIALILNQKFHGRAVARALFFLPVIVASSLVINIIRADVFTNNLMSGDNAAIFQTTGITDLLQTIEILGGGIGDWLAEAIAGIFDLTWKTGIQIILFISGLQAIPDSYYEVASIEGANAWDSFWKITAPMVTPSILLVVIYSIIDTFTDQNYPIMKVILSEFKDKIQYDRASAMAMVLFLVIGLIIGLVTLIMRKMVFYNE